MVIKGYFLGNLGIGVLIVLLYILERFFLKIIKIWFSRKKRSCFLEYLFLDYGK